MYFNFVYAFSAIVCDSYKYQLEKNLGLPQESIVSTTEPQLLLAILQMY